jgi:hypothetical protein
MKRLLKNLFVFIGILAIFLGSCILLTIYRSDFKFDKEETMMVVGHSHSECSFHDKFISGLTNRSNSGQSYFYNYFKVQELIKDNPQLETIFIEFSNLDVLEQKENWIWGEEKMVEYFPKYAFYMDVRSHELLYENNPHIYKTLILPVLKRGISAVFKGFELTEDTGKFQALQDTMAGISRNEPNLQPVDISAIEVADLNLKYLEKMIELVRSSGIDVILVRSPLHPSYNGFQAEELFQKVRKDRFNNVKFLDFANFPLTASDFADAEHLNESGAKQFSVKFNQLLNSGILELQDFECSIKE